MENKPVYRILSCIRMYSQNRLAAMEEYREQALDLRSWLADATRDALQRHFPSSLTDMKVRTWPESSSNRSGGGDGGGGDGVGGVNSVSGCDSGIGRSSNIFIVSNINR